MSTYPTVRPSLTLDFQKTKQLDPRIAFSRSSAATYVEGGVVKNAYTDQARFEAEGLLIEESRTNEVVYSEDLTQTNWGKYGVTITSNAINAPDGLTTADKMFSTSGAALLAVQQAKTGLTNAAQYSRSVFFKAAELTSATMQIGGTTEGTILCVVDLSNGTSTGGGVVTAYSNGWYKVERTFTMSGTTNDFYLRLPNSSAANSGVYVWGVQLEEGSFPTSYIPTAGSAVIRSADIAEITGTNFSSWFNQSESTVVTKMTDNGEPNTTNNRDIYYLGTGSSSGNNRIITTTGSVIGAYVQTTGAQVSITGGWYTKGVETVGAFAFKQDNFALATDGVIRGTDNSGDLPTCNRLYLFMNRNKANTLTGHIFRLSYYSRRLTDSKLQTITL